MTRKRKAILAACGAVILVVSGGIYSRHYKIETQGSDQQFTGSAKVESVPVTQN